MDPSPSISSVHPSDDMSNVTSPNLIKSRSTESLMTSKYNPSIQEIHISSIVSRRGYLNFLEESGTNWVKKYVVCLKN